MYSTARSKVVARVVRHIDVVTCLCADRGGAHVLTGSRDTTSILWEVAAGAAAAEADVDGAPQGQVRNAAKFGFFLKVLYCTHVAYAI